MIGLGIALNYWNKEIKSGEYKIVKLPVSVIKAFDDNFEKANRYMKIVRETRNWWKGYQQDCIDSATKELEKKNDKIKDVEVRYKSR